MYRLICDVFIQLLREGGTASVVALLLGPCDDLDLSEASHKRNRNILQLLSRRYGFSSLIARLIFEGFGLIAAVHTTPDSAIRKRIEYLSNKANSLTDYVFEKARYT